MNVFRRRPVDEAGTVVIEDEHAAVEVARGDEGFEARPETSGMGAGQRLFRVASFLQHVAPREEAIVGHLGRGVGKERIFLARLPQAVLDFTRGVPRIDARIDRDPHVEAAPGGHGRGPVAPFDLTDVEIDRMIEVFEIGIVALPFVPPRFKTAQGPDQAKGCLDRVGAGSRLADVNRPAPHMDAEPDHADIRAHEHVVFGFRNDRRVRLVPAQQAGKRAVAGALLLGHRLDIDRGRRLVAEPFEGVEREDIGGKPRLHVAAAAPVKPVAVDARREGRIRPHVKRTGRDHVDVAIQDERAALLFFRPMGSNHVERIVVAHLNRRKPWMVLDLVHVNHPTVHRVSPLGEGAIDEVLGGVLLPSERGKADQLLGECNLALEAIVDGFEDPGRQGVIERRRANRLRFFRHWMSSHRGDPENRRVDETHHDTSLC